MPITISPAIRLSDVEKFYALNSDNFKKAGDFVLANLLHAPTVVREEASPLPNEAPVSSAEKRMLDAQKLLGTLVLLGARHGFADRLNGGLPLPAGVTAPSTTDVMHALEAYLSAARQVLAPPQS